MQKTRLFWKTYAAHVAILVLGAGMMLGGCFHSNLWFDEAFTVGMMRLDLPDLLHAASYDVHPPLYYLLLKGVVTLFGQSLFVMRLFSVVGSVLFATLGLTHLRKDFGAGVGFWFSFFASFSGAVFFYALQIRMYSWVMYFVALAAIYCYRLCLDGSSRKTRVLFLTFSVCAAYLHYYGLFAVIALNLLLLYKTCREKLSLKIWLQNAAIQIGVYLPGLFVFFRQLAQGGATWISLKWPNMVFDLASHHLLGSEPQFFFEYKSAGYYIVGGIATALYVTGAVLLRRMYKGDTLSERQQLALKASTYVYYGIIVAILAVSLFRPLYHVRYTVVISVFFLFAAALLLASFRKKWPKVVACLLVLCFFLGQGAYRYDVAYHESSHAIQDVLDPRIQEEDCLLFDNSCINGFVLAVQYPQTQAYFYNAEEWQVQNAYLSFGHNTHVLDAWGEKELSLLPSRVWLAGKGCYELLTKAGYREEEHHTIKVRYHNFSCELYLMVKE